MGGILFPFNQYSNIYSRLLEKDDAENKFTASAEGANDPKVPNNELLKLLKTINVWYNFCFFMLFCSKLNVTLLSFYFNNLKNRLLVEF